MKRKILFLAIMILSFVLMLSISAYATYEQGRTEINYTDTNDNTHKVPVVKLDATAEDVNNAIKADTARGHNCDINGLKKMMDNDAYAILKDTQGGLTAYPTWYLIDASGAEIYEICYAYLNSKSDVTGKTYKEGAIVYIEFPHGMTGVRTNGVFGKKNNGAPYETNVTDFYIPSTVTYIGGSTFNDLKFIKNVYIEPGNKITKIEGGTFSNSSVEYIQFENLPLLTSIDGMSSCNITGDVDLSHCTALKTINAGCFQSSKKMGKITLPNSVETIGNNAFESTGNAYLASPYLPTSLKSVGIRFFAYNNNLLDTYIFPEGVTSLPSEPFQDSVVAGGPTGKQLNIVFLGKVTGVVYLNGNGHQKHAEEVTVYFAQNSKSEYNSNGFYIKPSGSSKTSVPEAIRAVFCAGTGTGTNGNVTGVEYIYITSTSGASYTSDYVNHETYGFDYDGHTHYGAANVTAPTCGVNGFEGKLCIVCDKEIGTVLPATGLHIFADDHNCQTADECSVCGAFTEVLEHILNVEIVFENGYAKAGQRTEVCTREGCEYCGITVTNPILTFLGFSKNEAETSLCVGYHVDYDLANEYKSIYSLEGFEYGFTMAVASNTADNSPLTIEDGRVATKAPINNGAIFKIIMDKYCSKVDLRLQGDFSAYQDLEILMGAYIYDGTRLVYIDDEERASIAPITMKDAPNA